MTFQRHRSVLWWPLFHLLPPESLTFPLYGYGKHFSLVLFTLFWHYCITYYTYKLLCKRIFHKSQWFQKCIILEMSRNFKNLKKLDPPSNWKLLGVYFLQLFQILTYCGVKWIFLIFWAFFQSHFPLKPLTSVKNPFA